MADENNLHRESSMYFGTQLNEPFRFEDDKLNQDFGVNHKFCIWTTEPRVNLLSPSSLRIEDLRVGYDFCANLSNPSLMFIGSSMLDGTLGARIKYDISDRLTMKTNTQIIDKTYQTMCSFDYKRADFITQLQIGTNIPVKAGYNIPVKASYRKSVTPELSLHGEVSWNVNGKKDCVFAARYESPILVVVGQVSSTRCAIMSHFLKISETVSCVSNLMYDHVARDFRSRIGCVYSWRQGRLLANIDSRAVFAAHLEGRLVEGLGVILSTELDARTNERKIGCGIILTS